MKLLYSATLVAALVCVAFLASPNSDLPAQIQSQPIPGVQSTDSTRENYRVIDISGVTVNSGGAAVTLEALLNENAAQGWRLREAAGNYLILVR